MQCAEGTVLAVPASLMWLGPLQSGLGEDVSNKMILIGECVEFSFCFCFSQQPWFGRCTPVRGI